MSESGTPSALGALHLVYACRAKLEKLNKALRRRQWQQVTDLAGEYSLLLKGIEALEGGSEMQGELVQLDIFHRRTMRQLSSQMRAVNEDIHSLESGQKSARHSQSVAKTIYSC